MFLSKIWFFLVTVVAVLAITIALVMPRPAERAGLVQENKSVRTACQVTEIVLVNAAHERIQLTSEFAQAVRMLKLSTTLYEASKDEIISGQTNATGRNELTKLLKGIKGTKPSFVWLLDRRGRVVARSNAEDQSFGESVRGYPLVQDALDGYVRDDLWLLESGMYRVAAAPVLTRELEWAGAIVLGQAIDKTFAAGLAGGIATDINFYVGTENVASSKPVQIHKDIVAGAQELASIDEGQDCATSTVHRVKAGDTGYVAVSARLPGAAGKQGAFYTVYTLQAEPLDFMGTLSAVKKDDLGFDRFPWIPVALCFILLMAIGFYLMFFDVEGPLKRLNKEAVALAQEEQDRFHEDSHRSKYGSIARSVNIAIDKMQRATKTAKKDLDQLLGPASSSDGVDAATSALPPVGPGGDLGGLSSPPPSEFKFGEAPAPAAADLGLTPPPSMPGLTAPPAAVPVATPSFADKTPPPLPKNAPAKAPSDGLIPPTSVSLPNEVKQSIDADILAPDILSDIDPLNTEAPTTDSEELPTIIADDRSPTAYFEQIYQEFMNMKKKCGESTENLTFERFSKKLQKNQDALIEKRACASVKFQVYEKDGKAALKASPVK